MPHGLGIENGWFDWKWGRQTRSCIPVGYVMTRTNLTAFHQFTEESSGLKNFRVRIRSASQHCTVEEPMDRTQTTEGEAAS